MTDYGVGERDKRIAELEAELDVATRELVKQGQKLLEVSEELAKANARLAEVDSWRTGEVPEGVDRIEVVWREKDIAKATRQDRHFNTDFGWFIDPFKNRWRPLKEVK